MVDIDFDEIPASLRQPGNYFELNTKDANSALPSNVQKMIIVAQFGAGGTAVANEPTSIFSTAEAETKFVRGSIAHITCRDAIRANPNIQLYVCPVSDAGAAVAAIKTLTITAVSAVGGKLIVRINAKRFEVPFSEGQTPTEIAANLATILKTDVFIPYAITVAAGVVTLTAVSKGDLAETTPIVIDNTLADGASMALASTVTGIGTPDISTTLAAISSKRFNIHVSTFNDTANLAFFRTYVIAQSGAIEKKATRCHFAVDPAKTISEALAFAAALNEGRMNPWICRKSISASFTIATVGAALDASEEKASRPLNGLECIGVGAPISSNDYLTNAEIETLLYGGVSPMQADPTGSIVEVVRWITSYTNKSGTPDPTLLDGTVLKSLDYTRDSVTQRMDIRFPRTNIEEKTAGNVRNEILDILFLLEDEGILRFVEENKDKLIVVESGQTGTLVASIPAAVVPGLHVIAGVIKLIL